MRIRIKFTRRLQKNRVRGMVHFHSSFSYDGCDSIGDIVSFLKERGYSFACPTEHDDDFSAEKMEEFVKACQNASDNSFKVIPGLEFRCNNKLHILGIGVEKYFFTKDPLDAVKKIKEQGGIAVIAHPRKHINNITRELLDAVDGIEIWNGQKDSRFMPHYKMLAYYKKVKNKYPNIRAFCGPDLHSLSNFFELGTVIYSDNIENILKESSQEMQGKYINLSVDGEGFLFAVLTLAIMRGVLNFVKSLRDFLIKLGN